MIATSIRDNTIKMLCNRPVWLTFAIISKETSIPIGWLKALSRGKISDPGVNRIETLQAFLISKECK